MKTPQEMAMLREKGLDRLYLGVESGDDDVRRSVSKGSSAQHCLEMGLKVKNAGMKLIAMVLLGIAGKENSLNHARATGELLSAMDPDHVAALTIICVPGTPFFESCERGDITLPDERGFLLEMKEMIQHTTLTQGVFASNHASNYLPVEIKFPHGKQEVLNLIDTALMGKITLKPEWMRAF
jgi:coproporphyrinogen III oxidase-like Fe-S oxidoreductase